MKRFALVGKDIKIVLAQQYTHIALMGIGIDAKYEIIDTLIRQPK